MPPPPPPPVLPPKAFVVGGGPAGVVEGPKLKDGAFVAGAGVVEPADVVGFPKSGCEAPVPVDASNWPEFVGALLFPGVDRFCPNVPNDDEVVAGFLSSGPLCCPPNMLSELDGAVEPKMDFGSPLLAAGLLPKPPNENPVPPPALLPDPKGLPVVLFALLFAVPKRDEPAEPLVPGVEESKPNLGGSDMARSRYDARRGCRVTSRTIPASVW